MKHLLFIFTFYFILMAGNSHAHDGVSKNLSDRQRLFSEMNLCCAFDLSFDQYIIDDQETNEIIGLNLFVEDPEIQFMKLNGGGFRIQPVVLFTPQLKVITLLSDLPPPRLS